MSPLPPPWAINSWVRQLPLAGVMPAVGFSCEPLTDDTLKQAERLSIGDLGYTCQHPPQKAFRGSDNWMTILHVIFMTTLRGKHLHPPQDVWTKLQEVIYPAQGLSSYWKIQPRMRSHAWGETMLLSMSPCYFVFTCSQTCFLCSNLFKNKNMSVCILSTQNSIKKVLKNICQIEVRSSLPK
jgi:hypothetical protein